MIEIYTQDTGFFKCSKEFAKDFTEWYEKRQLSFVRKSAELTFIKKV